MPLQGYMPVFSAVSPPPTSQNAGETFPFQQERRWLSFLRLEGHSLDGCRWVLVLVLDRGLNRMAVGGECEAAILLEGF